jgi:hypothetical protein
MTTIAWDGKTLAADTLVTANGMAFGKAKKIHKLKDGRYFALCGSFSVEPAVIEWLNGGEKPQILDVEGVGGIVVEKNGRAFEFGRAYRLFPACVPWAGGSGEQIAMTAMKCGKTAVEAVKVACKLDIHTREPVDYIRIKK